MLDAIQRCGIIPVIKLEEIEWDVTYERLHQDEDDLPFTDPDEPDESEWEEEDG